MSYNPITNPIPVINQNPYISKGRLDHVITLRPKGKIVTTQDHFYRERHSTSVINWLTYLNIFSSISIKIKI